MHDVHCCMAYTHYTLGCVQTAVQLAQMRVSLALLIIKPTYLGDMLTIPMSSLIGPMTWT